MSSAAGSQVVAELRRLGGLHKHLFTEGNGVGSSEYAKVDRRDRSMRSAVHGMVREAAPALKKTLGRECARLEDVQRTLADFGLELQRKGSGLVVYHDVRTLVCTIRGRGRPMHPRASSPFSSDGRRASHPPNPNSCLGHEPAFTRLGNPRRSSTHVFFAVASLRRDRRVQSVP